MRTKNLLRGLGLLGLLGCGSTDPNPADSSPPQVLITHPTDGDVVNGQVSIDVLAIDDFGVDKVRIFKDNTLLIEQYTPPFHALWNTSSEADNSAHIIKVEALDVAKNLRSVSIGVTVSRGPN